MEAAANETELSQNTPLQVCQREVEALRSALALALEQSRGAKARVQDLENANQALQQRKREGQQSNRLLEVTAATANVLLTITPFDTAVNTALQLIGESLETSRIAVHENFDRLTDTSFRYWRTLYDWNFENTIAQVAHPEAGQWSYEPIGEWYERMEQGQSISYLIDDAPEPFRNGQISIEVKATHLVPISVEGQFWGVLGLDDCREANRSPSELAVLKIAADCVGSAIQRERTQQVLQAEQERSQELAKANEALKRSLDSLASEPSLDKLLGQVLGAIAEQFDSPLAEYWYHPEDDTAYVGMISWQGQIYAREEIAVLYPTHPGVDGFKVPPEMVHGENLQHRKQYFIIDDWLVSPFVKHVKWMPENGLYKEINVPMVVGDDCIGALIVRMSREQPITTQQIELAQALAHQATLAAQLTRLAEEAKQAAIAKEQELAALARAEELVKANEALGRSLDKLANERCLESFLEHILQEALKMLDGAVAQIFLYNSALDTLTPVVGVDRQGTVFPAPGLMVELPISEAFPANITGAWKRLLNQRSPIHFDIERDADDYWPGTLDWHRSMGHRGAICVALMMSDQPLGILGLALHNRAEFTTSELEFFQALAQQATLAIQLTQLVEKTKQAVIAREQELAAQERAAELEKVNEELRQRDRLLSLVAEVSKDLLENAEVDSAIAQALQRIGEAAGISRMTLLQEKIEVSSGRLQHHVIQEWTAPSVPKQMEDSATKVMYSDEYGVLVNELRAGRSIWYTLEHLPEPARTQQAGIEVKSTGAVPIFIEGGYFGCVGFDDCVDYRQWSTPAIDVLTSGAGAIGAALHRKQLVDRLIEERIQAAQERAAELAKANESLRRSVERMVSDSRLETLISAFLTEAIETVGADAGAVMLRMPGSLKFTPAAIVVDGRLQSSEELAVDPFLSRYVEFSSTNIGGIFSMLARGETPSIRVDDLREVFPEAYTYHQQRGHCIIWHAPLRLQDQVIGFTGITLREDRLPSNAVRETVIALAQQLTLALELTRLADESKQAAIAHEQEKAAQERAAELAKANEALSRTSSRLANQPDLSAFLGYVTLEAAVQLKADAGGLAIFNEQRGVLQFGALVQQGQLLPIEPLATEMSVDEAEFYHILLETRKPRFFDLETEAHLFWAGAIQFHQQHNHRAVLAVPLFTGDEFLGHLGLAFTQDEPISEQGSELLQALAHQATLAIQLTRLAEEAKQAAILEERNRMAREIHDTLAQCLSGIIVQLQAAEDNYTSNAADRHFHIAQAIDLAELGLSEARRSVRALRPQALETASLDIALTQLAYQTSTNTLQATCYIQGILYTLPTQVEANLLRIAQEALTNCTRHANASLVEIALIYQPEQVQLQICDNGRGFNPNLSAPHCYGLIGMRERAAELGAELNIDTQVGTGTQVSVVLPILTTS